MSCIGEPVSWPRLELGERDAAITAHLATCAVCRSCADMIERDVVVLPPLVLPAVAARARWWLWAIPAVAAAALLVVVLRPPPQRADNITSVKGVGEVVLDVVRERGGTIRTGVTTFAPGDRWKVVVTCSPERGDKGAWIDVAVVEAGAHTADYPIAPAHVACGNDVVIPGAFELTGAQPNRVCVRVAADGAAPRGVPAPGDEGVACVTVYPERSLLEH